MAPTWHAARVPPFVRAKLRRVLGAALLYSALCLLLCWPLATGLRSQIPLGQLGEPTVPYFNLWTLIWNADRLAHGYAGYWDAPFFFPVHDTFAMSEPQGLTGLLFAPWQALTGPVAAYNLTLLTLLVANGLAGRRLVLTLGASQSHATWAGTLFVALPLVREELGVLQLCAAWPVLLSLSEIVLLTRGANPRAVLRLGLWLFATAWSCIYYALFVGLLIVLAAALLVRLHWRNRRMWLATFVALGIVVTGIGPLLTAESRAITHFKRSATSIHLGSGSALAYLQFIKDTPLARLLPRWQRPPGRRSLYPGALLCTLAVLGGVSALRSEPRRRRLGYSLAALAFMLLLSFGTRLHICGVTPYALTAQRYLPGFDQLRSPYRAALFVQALLAAWAGLGLQVVSNYYIRRAQPRAARAVPVACVLLAIFEVTPWHFTRTRFPSEALEEPWVAWLATQPPGAVAMLPPNSSGRAADYTETVVYMLQALQHGHPIVNGYSGFFPPISDRMVLVLRQFPSEHCLRALHNQHVRYAVVDRTLKAVRQLELHPSSELQPIYTTGPRWVYLVK